MPEPPALDGSRLGPRVDDIFILSDPRPVVVQGQSGAAQPGSIVRALNLDATSPPVEARASEDGSFQLTVDVSLGNELRFEAIDGTLRSPPVDVVFTQVDAVDAFASSLRHECLQIQPGVQVPFVGVGPARVNVSNGCAGAAALSRPRFRLAEPGVVGGFELSSPLPLSVAAGQSATLELRVNESSLQVEDVLFVDIEVLGRPIRYPFGLYRLD